VPKAGFSGAAAIDAQGRFSGIAVLRSSIDAGSGSVTRQAAVVPAAAVRAFLKAHGILPSLRRGNADQSVVRVICVRK
ncbi:MAG: peptidoglycan-binding protein, partial [Xanthobacteraceae bacterium]